MREFKIFFIVLVLVGITYWGIEPFAHSQLNPAVEPANFEFGKEKGELWDEVRKIDFAKGDAARGAEFAESCKGCHSIKAAGHDTGMSAKDASEAYGVTPPDLSDAGRLYDEKFLAALIKNPAVALKVSHKYNDENPHPMSPYAAMGENEAGEIADIVAFLKSIAPEKLSDKEAFLSACSRCHDVKYDNVFVEGNKQSLAGYLGMVAPDLSMYIRSRSQQHLRDFINDPQKLLPGTAMPRVGLKQDTQAQVVAYLEKVGDPKKDERNALGWKVMLYFLILSGFALAWKTKIWSKLH